MRSQHQSQATGALGTVMPPNLPPSSSPRSPSTPSGSMRRIRTDNDAEEEEGGDHDEEQGELLTRDAHHHDQHDPAYYFLSEPSMSEDGAGSWSTHTSPPRLAVSHHYHHPVVVGNGAWAVGPGSGAHQARWSALHVPVLKSPTFERLDDEDDDYGDRGHGCEDASRRGGGDDGGFEATGGGDDPTTPPRAESAMDPGDAALFHTPASTPFAGGRGGGRSGTKDDDGEEGSSCSSDVSDGAILGGLTPPPPPQTGSPATSTTSSQRRRPRRSSQQQHMQQRHGHTDAFRQGKGSQHNQQGPLHPSEEKTPLMKTRKKSSGTAAEEYAPVGRPLRRTDENVGPGRGDDGAANASPGGSGRFWRKFSIGKKPRGAKAGTKQNHRRGGSSPRKNAGGVAGESGGDATGHRGVGDDAPSGAARVVAGVTYETPSPATSGDAGPRGTAMDARGGGGNGSSDTDRHAADDEGNVYPSRVDVRGGHKRAHSHSARSDTGADITQMALPHHRSFSGSAVARHSRTNVPERHRHCHHRRTRSGDKAAATLMLAGLGEDGAGRGDWIGMAMDELPLPEDQLQDEDEDEDEDDESQHEHGERTLQSKRDYEEEGIKKNRKREAVQRGGRIYFDRKSKGQHRALTNNVLENTASASGSTAASAHEGKSAGRLLANEEGAHLSTGMVEKGDAASTGVVHESSGRNKGPLKAEGIGGHSPQGDKQESAQTNGMQPRQPFDAVESSHRGNGHDGHGGRLPLHAAASHNQRPASSPSPPPVPYPMRRSCSVESDTTQSSVFSWISGRMSQMSFSNRQLGSLGRNHSFSSLNNPSHSELSAEEAGGGDTVESDTSSGDSGDASQVGAPLNATSSEEDGTFRGRESAPTQRSVRFKRRSKGSAHDIYGVASDLRTDSRDHKFETPTQHEFEKIDGRGGDNTRGGVSVPVSVPKIKRSQSKKELAELYCPVKTGVTERSDASGNDGEDYPTFVCPRCGTRQREFFSVKSAPRQFESPAGFLALYFGVYVVAALFIFGLEEGWAPLDCVYFAVITLTTAGLGDFVPTTDGAKIVCSIFIYFGVACIGLLLGSLLASSLDDESRKLAKEQLADSCPNCQRLGLIGSAHKEDRFSPHKNEFSERLATQTPARTERIPRRISGKRFFSEAVTTSSHQTGLDGFYGHRETGRANANARRRRHVHDTPSDNIHGEMHYGTIAGGGGGGQLQRASHTTYSGIERGLRDAFDRVASSTAHAWGNNSRTGASADCMDTTDDPLSDGDRATIDEETPMLSPTFANMSPTTPMDLLRRSSHTRHVSLDISNDPRAFSKESLYFPSSSQAVRGRKFSHDVHLSSKIDDYTIDENSVYEENSGNGIVNNTAHGPRRALNVEQGFPGSTEEDESSSSSSSSEMTSSSDPLAKFDNFKAARHVFLTLKQAVMNSILIIAIGSLGFHYIEGKNAVDSFYFTTVLLTTVGYGDIVPITPEGKMFATIYVLVAGTVLLHNMSMISMIPLELRKQRIESAVLRQFGEHLDDIALRELATGPLVKRLQLAADRSDGLNECTREMFALAMLVRLGRITEQDVNSTFAAFRRLDRDNDGKLDSKDIIYGEVEKRRKMSLRRPSRRRHSEYDAGTNDTFAYGVEHDLQLPFPVNNHHAEMSYDEVVAL